MAVCLWMVVSLWLWWKDDTVYVSCLVFFRPGYEAIASFPPSAFECCARSDQSCRWKQEGTQQPVNLTLKLMCLNELFIFFPFQITYLDMLVSHWNLTLSLTALFLLYIFGIFDRNNAPNVYPSVK